VGGYENYYPVLFYEKSSGLDLSGRKVALARL
jgi:hypothetical protein